MNFKNLFKFIVIFYISLISNGFFGQNCERETTNLNFVEYKNYSSINRTIFSHFNTFDQLNANNCSHYEITNFLIFIPKKRVILEESFAPRNWFTFKQLTSIKCVEFFNLKGFDINQRISFVRNKPISLVIFSSQLEFYSNLNLIDSTKCDLDTFTNVSFNFFNLFDVIKLANTKFPTIICPYVFSNNSNIKILYLSHISNSFLLKNRLNFDEKTRIALNVFKELYLDIKYESLTHKNLNKHLFKQMSLVSVIGVLNEIETDLFASFFFLKNVNFQLENFRQFFHNSNNEWMNVLNKDVNANMSDIRNLNLNRLVDDMMILSVQYLTLLTSFTRVYEFPNEDLCLFKYFPHNHAVLTLLDSNIQLKCTCSIYWLQFYANLYRSVLKFNSSYFICDKTFNSSQCDVKK